LVGIFSQCQDPPVIASEPRERSNLDFFSAVVIKVDASSSARENHSGVLLAMTGASLKNCAQHCGFIRKDGFFRKEERNSAVEKL
jgi:hypothetical protein